MKWLFLGGFLLSSFLYAIGQEKIFYVQKNHDFVLLVDSSTTVEIKDIDGGYILSLVIGGPANFKFAVSIGREQNPEWENRSLSSKDFINKFENDANCVVVSQKEISYNNFTSIQFAVQLMNNGDTINGLADNILVGSTLFTIFYISNPEDFELHIKQYENMMNSLVINPNLY